MQQVKAIELMDGAALSSTEHEEQPSTAVAAGKGFEYPNGRHLSKYFRPNCDVFILHVWLKPILPQTSPAAVNLPKTLMSHSSGCSHFLVG